MTGEESLQMFATLSATERAEIDDLIRDFRHIQAITRLRELLAPGLRLYDLQDIVHARRGQLGLPFRDPRLARSVEAALELLRGRTTAAVEALWDGDTHGWFVDVVGIVEGSSREHPRYSSIHLATFADDGGDFRIFAGSVPPWPEATRATRFGEEVASRLAISFYFASPDKPDDYARRWWGE